MIEYDLINLNEIPRVIWRWAVGAWLAQSVERWTFNPTVAGSSPASGLTFFTLLLWTRNVLIRNTIKILVDLNIRTHIHYNRQRCKG